MNNGNKLWEAPKLHYFDKDVKISKSVKEKIDMHNTHTKYISTE